MEEEALLSRTKQFRSEVVEGEGETSTMTMMLPPNQMRSSLLLLMPKCASTFSGCSWKTCHSKLLGKFLSPQRTSLLSAHIVSLIVSTAPRKSALSWQCDALALGRMFQLFFSSLFITQILLHPFIFLLSSSSDRLQCLTHF